MTRFPRLTLSQAKITRVICWFLVCVAQFFVLFIHAQGQPMKEIPIFIRISVAVLLLIVVCIVIYTTIDKFIEKPDERAVLNNYRANSLLYSLFFVLFGLYIIFGEKLGINTFSINREQIIFLFSLLNLAQDGLFLFYERFGS